MHILISQGMSGQKKYIQSFKILEHKILVCLTGNSFSWEIACSPNKSFTIYPSWSSIFQQNSLIHHCYANDALLYPWLPADSPGEILMFQAYVEDIKFDITEFLAPSKC